VPDSGIICDLLWSDPDKDIEGWGENDRGVSFTFGGDVVAKFLKKHDLDLVCRAHQVVEDGYEFFAKRRLVTIFSAPNYCGEFDNAGAMMSVDESLMCSFQILKPAEKKEKFAYGGQGAGRPITPPRGKDGTPTSPASPSDANAPAKKSVGAVEGKMITKSGTNPPGITTVIPSNGTGPATPAQQQQQQQTTTTEPAATTTATPPATSS